jgi:hypothetical protein
MYADQGGSAGTDGPGRGGEGEQVEHTPSLSGLDLRRQARRRDFLAQFLLELDPAFRRGTTRVTSGALDQGKIVILTGEALGATLRYVHG